MPSRREILRREIGEKIRLEESFKPAVRRIFRRVLDDFRVSVASTGRPQDVSRYRALFESSLDEHYRKVQKTFSGAILMHNNADAFVELRRKQVEQEDDDIDELILAMFLLWREEHAPLQADIITGTTFRDMQDAVAQARQELTELGQPTDSRSVAAAASTILSRTLRNRVELIAVTETQAAAETAKAIEASATTRISIPGITVPASIVQVLEPAVTPVVERTLRKTWLTLQDDRVRDTHRAVQGRTVELNEPFIVGGARMMYPGDASLGAPIRELANCRCSAQYTVGAAT